MTEKSCYPSPQGEGYSGFLPHNRCWDEREYQKPDIFLKRSNIQKVIILLLLFFSSTSFAQTTQGFFLDDFTPQTFTRPSSYNEIEKPSAAATVSINVNFEEKIAQVSKYVFGNNANIYMTQMVDQPALLDYISKLSPNVIRFPGGNLSSVYFWNAEKDAPPADAPAQLLDANGTSQSAGYWYGKNNEGWTCSVDNYYGMLSQTNSTGIITINYGYARYSTATDPVASAAHLAAEWVRYDNGRTKFWEIGNESGGSWQAGYRIKTSDNKDGQPEIITGELYGRHFKVFADSMRKAADEIDAQIYIGAQLLAEAAASWWNDTDRFWNSGVFQEAANVPDFYIIHSYYTPYATNSNANDILASADKVTTDMMNYVVQSEQSAGVTIKPLTLTEWNIFAEGSKQSASYINGMHAAIVLGELIKNKYGLAARWDLANGWSNGNDHGMFNQGDEPGNVPKWNPRAAFYYIYYFQKYFGDEMVGSAVSGNSSVLAYASSFESGEAGMVVVNKGNTAQTVQINMEYFGYGERFYLYSLTGGTDNGEFSLKVNVNGTAPTYSTGGPVNFEQILPSSAAIGSGVKFTVPPRSVHYVVIENGSNVITSVEKESFPKVNVYPNPAKDSLTIQFHEHGCSRVRIIDASGRIIVDEPVGAGEKTKTIHAKLSSGVYMVELTGDGKKDVTRVVVE